MNEGQVLPDGTSDCHACGCHSRLRGNGCLKPLDSGLRRNDGGGWISACSRITTSRPLSFQRKRACTNDEGIWGQAFVRRSEGTVGMATHFFSLHRHSSAGWNPGRRAEECRNSRFCQMARPVVMPVIVIPAMREWMFKTTGFLGRLFQTCLQQAGAALPPTSMQAGLRRNDEGRFRPAPGGYRSPRRFVPNDRPWRE